MKRLSNFMIKNDEKNQFFGDWWFSSCDGDRAYHFLFEKMKKMGVDNDRDRISVKEV